MIKFLFSYATAFLAFGMLQAPEQPPIKMGLWESKRPGCQEWDLPATIRALRRMRCGQRKVMPSTCSALTNRGWHTSTCISIAGKPTVWSLTSMHLQTAIP
jgi:sirohydrochlorin ferrochelatase